MSSRARRLIEAMCPAPAVEPKPGVKPGTRPSAPPPKRREHPDPFRRREIRPGEEPRPKARMESHTPDDLYSGIKKRFMDERARTGHSPEESERLWAKSAHKFRAASHDPEVQRRTGTSPSPGFVAATAQMEGKKKSLKTPPQGGKAAHAFKTKKMITKSSGAGASGLTAKKAFKK